MTTSTSSATGPTSTSTATGPTAAERLRAARGPLAVGLLVLLAALVVAVSTGRSTDERLDPRSAGPSGSRALAEVLRDQGVRVDVARTTARVGELSGRTPDGTTVLVTQPDLLAPSQVSTLAGTGADLVVVEAAQPERFAPGVTVAEARPESEVREPGCRLTAARRAGPADAGGAYRVRPGTPARSCYGQDGLPALVQVTGGERRVVLLGSGSALTNRRLDDEGNAALATGLLGADEHLVWYLPSLSDLPAGAADESVYDLVPVGVWWGVVQLGVAVLVLALWRGRRLGPVVTEPLPVVVRAAEAVEGRARLYQRGQARGTAAEALRSGHRSRLSGALGLPAAAAPPVVVDALAARTGRPAADVAALLYGAAPADDAALVRLADDLDALDQEARRP